MLSKRKLIQLVEGGHVDGWDDPRMPTLVGARRRGFTPEGFRLFNERIGVSKSDAWIDIGVLEEAMRDDLNASARAPHRRARSGEARDRQLSGGPIGDARSLPNHPQRPELGRRELTFSRELWIERDDFAEAAAEGVLPALAGRRGAPALRLHREVHGRREGRAAAT